MRRSVIDASHTAATAASNDKAAATAEQTDGQSGDAPVAWLPATLHTPRTVGPGERCTGPNVVRFLPAWSCGDVLVGELPARLTVLAYQSTGARS